MSGKPKIQDLGWANGWPKTPEIVRKCRELGHTPSDTGPDAPYKCFDHTVRCDICGYVYHYDSSG